MTFLVLSLGFYKGLKESFVHPSRKIILAQNVNKIALIFRFPSKSFSVRNDNSPGYCQTHAKHYL